MPKRSTPFQAIVRLVRQHFAQPGVTVTESKMLRDAALDVEREVDIVIEGKFDGEPIVISVEVIEHGRPATLPWVEQMLGKHRGLPTNRLLLVSKSGFSGKALAAIESQAGRVQALTPEMIDVNGDAVVKRFFVDAIDYNPTGCKVHVRNGDERIAVVGVPLMDVYAEDESLLGPLSYLVQDTVGLDAIRLRLLLEAHQRAEKNQVKAFSVNVAIPQLGYHLQQSDTRQLHLIEELEIWDDFAVSQTEIPLIVSKLGDRIYGAAEAPIAGRPAVWVGTSDLEAQTTTISWQTTDPPVPPQLSVQLRPIHFPGLLSLFLAPDRIGTIDPAPATSP